MMMIMNPWRIHKCQANCLLSSLLGICTPGTFSGFLWVNKLQAMLGMEIGITFIPNQRTTLQGNTFKWEGEHDMLNISLNRYCLEVSSNQLLFDLQIFQRHDRSAPKEFHQNSISLECWVVPAANLCPAVYIRTCLLYNSLSFTHQRE